MFFASGPVTFVDAGVEPCVLSAAVCMSVELLSGGFGIVLCVVSSICTWLSANCVSFVFPWFLALMPFVH